MMTLKFSHRVFTGLMVLIALSARAVYACEAMAANEIEKLYCAVVAKGEGASLPSFDDFRRNPESTQRLLLKRPAERAGLTLPKVAATQSQPSAKSSSPAPSPLPAMRKKRASGFSGCQVAAQQLVCDGVVYRLLDNKSNAALAPGALDSANQLQLPAVPAYRSDGELHNYLMHAYSIYIEKMDSIGLAGNTLSYSKFYYIFEDVKNTQQDFVARFKNMFVYLKKDKSTIGVGRSHTSGVTPTLNYCEMIHGDLITCDDHGKNWVYKR